MSAETFRDRSRHVDGVVAVAERHPERRPKRGAALADEEGDRSAARKLLARGGALRDHAWIKMQLDTNRIHRAMLRCSISACTMRSRCGGALTGTPWAEQIAGWIGTPSRPKGRVEAMSVLLPIDINSPPPLGYGR